MNNTPPTLEVEVYQKENNLRLGKLLKESLTDIINSRFLTFQLAKRDIQAQYRQSYLGIIWAFVTPLAYWLYRVWLQRGRYVAIEIPKLK